jgi:hypothetical protein
MHHDGPADASHRFDDGVDVERNECAQIDHLGADTLLLQRVGSG